MCFHGMFIIRISKEKEERPMYDEVEPGPGEMEKICVRLSICSGLIEKKYNK